jgi:PAS domain S-box-containing protein
MSRLVKLLPGDVGRPIIDMSQEHLGGDLVSDAQSVLEHLSPAKEETGINGAWYVRNILPYRTSDNRIEGVVIMYTDITERKRTEEEQKGLAKDVDEVRARLQAIIDSLPVGLWIADADGKMVLINDIARAIWGRAATYASGVEGYGEYKAWRADTGEPVRAEDMPLARAIGGETCKDQVLDFERFDGTRGTQLVSAAPVKDSTGIIIGSVAAVLDITERRRMEEETRRFLAAVREEKDRLSALVNSIQDEVWFADTDKNFTLANPSALREFGFGTADAIDVEKMAASLEVHRPDGSARPIDEAPPLRALKGEVVRNQQEIVRTPASGELRYREVSAAPVRGVGGDIIGSVSVVRDITERKRAEEALRESQATLQAALASMTDAVFISDADGNFIEFNDAFATFHRFRNKDECWKGFARYSDIFEGFLPDGEPAPPDMWPVKRALRGEIGANAELSVRRKDTGERWVASYSFSPIRDKDGHIVGSVTAGRDITERKRAEEELRESQRLLRDIIDSSPSAIFLKDVDGKFITINAPLEKMLGMSRDELKGKTDYDIASKDVADYCGLTMNRL